MTFSFHLLRLPYPVLLLLLVASFTAVSIAFTYLFKKHVAITAQRAHNEATGYIFATVGGLYGLLLGFVVFLVWGAFNTAQSDANREGSLARGLYRDIRYFPDTAGIAPLKNVYMAYVDNVLHREYPEMQQMKQLDATDRRAFNRVFAKLEIMDSGDIRVDQMFRHLNELNTYRGLRILAGSSAIPTAMWIPLMLGALIVLMIASVLDIESRKLHIFLNGALGAFIGLTFYLIIMLDHPFSGSLRITPDEYQRIVLMHAEED